jgi:3-isopropylmalate/(R)-2-methylmalate dehydratase small subunit
VRFNTVTSNAVPLAEDNIDTDVIYPGRFLLRIDKQGAGDCLFYDKRSVDNEIPHVVDQQHFQGAQILVSGENFGCGSSREQAVWALHDFGFRCIIAKSFGEIFYSNCINNQVLPVVIADADYLPLLNAAKSLRQFHVDLNSQHLSVEGGPTIGFEIGQQHRDMLLLGLDEISLQLKDDSADIKRFETAQKRTQPWLWEPLFKTI